MVIIQNPVVSSFITLNVRNAALFERGLFSLLHCAEGTAECVPKHESSATEDVELVECDDAEELMHNNIHMTATNICSHQLPRLSHTSSTIALYSELPEPFSGFFPENIQTDKPSDLSGWTLAMVQLEDVSSTAPRARGLTVPAQCRLSRRLFCAVSGREAAHSAGQTRLVNKLIHNSVSKHLSLSLTDCLE